EREVAAASDGAVQLRDHCTAARRGRDLHPQVPSFPRLLDGVSLETRKRLVGDLRLGRDMFAAVAPELANVFVGFAAAIKFGLALDRPLPLPARPIDELMATSLIVGVFLLRVTACRLPFVEIRLPSARKF